MKIVYGLSKAISCLEFGFPKAPWPSVNYENVYFEDFTFEVTSFSESYCDFFAFCVILEIQKEHKLKYEELLRTKNVGESDSGRFIVPDYVSCFYKIKNDEVIHYPWESETEIEVYTPDFEKILQESTWRTLLCTNQLPLRFRSYRRWSQHWFLILCIFSLFVGIMMGALDLSLVDVLLCFVAYAVVAWFVTRIRKKNTEDRKKGWSEEQRQIESLLNGTELDRP